MRAESQPCVQILLLLRCPGPSHTPCPPLVSSRTTFKDQPYLDMDKCSSMSMPFMKSEVEVALSNEVRCVQVAHTMQRIKATLYDETQEVANH